MNVRTRLALTLCTLILSAPAAFAATTTGTLTVNAQVLDSCTVANAVLDFGVYSTPIGAVQTTTVDVNCSLLSPYTLSVGQGQNYAGSSNRMRATISGTPHYIPYSVAFDGSVLGLLTGVGLGVPAPTPITGLAPAGANVPAGNYTDSVTLTVSF